MRDPAQAYAPFYRERGIQISQELAGSQFDAYADALVAAGLEVHFVAHDDDYPDCVFLEDAAVVWPPSALVARMTPHREGEQAAVELALRRWHAVEPLPPGALLEGGDVLHIEGTTYVGLTSRTNEAGAEALREFMRPSGQTVVAVRVGECLHLKTAATYLGDGVLVAAPDLVDVNQFDVRDVIPVDASERDAANCLRVRNHLLIPAGRPRAEKLLRTFAERKGVEVVPLDISEFQKADGSLTCLSLVW